MTTEIQAALNIVGVAAGVAAGWYSKVYSMKSGKGALTKEEHREYCGDKLKPVYDRLENGEIQFNKLFDRLDVLKEQILEAMYKNQKPWDGVTDRRKGTR